MGISSCDGAVSSEDTLLPLALQRNQGTKMQKAMLQTPMFVEPNNAASLTSMVSHGKVCQSASMHTRRWHRQLQAHPSNE